MNVSQKDSGTTSWDTNAKQFLRLDLPERLMVSCWLAERARFDVLLTVDRGIARQQKMSGRNIALLVLHVRSNEIDDLLAHVPACLEALRSIKPGEVVRVE